MPKMPTVIIYTKDNCTYCIRAKQLLAKKRVQFQEINVTNSEKLQQEMITKSSRMTVPQIFINGKHIGGCDDLYALDAKGKLDPLLKE